MATKTTYDPRAVTMVGELWGRVGSVDEIIRRLTDAGIPAPHGVWRRHHVLGALEEWRWSRR